MTIDLKAQETPVIQKTKELCETILLQPQFQSLQQDIDGFMADTAARGLYELFIEKQQFLVEKQQRGQTLSEEEIGDFEKDRDELMANGVVRQFVEARDQIQVLQQTVVDYVTKTVELGRVPVEADFQTGCCGGGGGGGCGCSG